MEELRPFTLDDAPGVADLETARTPDEPIGAAMMAYWWTHPNDGMKSMRWVAKSDAEVAVYVEALHDAWQHGERRFGWVQASVHPDAWTASLYRDALATAEAWVHAEGAEVAVATAREDFERELVVLANLGYGEKRRERYWELDLVARRDELIAAAAESRDDMRRQGIELLTLGRDRSLETLQQVFKLDVATTKDIPTTVPIQMPGFETWYRNYLENPGIREDRFWIAKVGDDVVGLSLIVFPPERGVPSTEYTAISAQHRGRGIARALKYQTVAQAIAVGATRIRTDNDSENAPILHINEEMGYRPIKSYIELHRDL